MNFFTHFYLKTKTTKVIIEFCHRHRKDVTLNYLEFNLHFKKNLQFYLPHGTVNSSEIIELQVVGGPGPLN